MALMPEGDEIAIIRDDGETDPETGAVIRPAWLPGETVSIRTYGGDGTKRRIRDALLVIQQDPVTGQPAGLTYNTGAAAAIKLREAIVSWTLIYERSKRPIPCTPATIDRLPTAYADFILAEVNKAWDAWDAVPGGGNDPDKDARFSGPADTGDGQPAAAATG